ncbi:MAG: glucose-6-phosphate isomerase [Halobacteriales archaeon]
MHVDLGNTLASVADPGIARESLDRLDRQIATAHDRIDRGRADNEFGYTALNLPDRTDPATIRAAAESFPEETIDTVLVVGIGGSALGAVTLHRALETTADLYALDNIDPAHTNTLLERLDLERTVLNVVSRSGTTAETLANFLVVREAMAQAGVDWTDRTLVTTGETGPLRTLVERHGLPSLRVPPNVPGRFAALSAVGLAPVALAGGDIEAVLDGGADAAGTLSSSLFECPAYAYGAISEALARRGCRINAMIPYAESLEPFAEWFAQLWAESLGKEGCGQTPARALGTTDQHSQLQLYRAGPRTTQVTFLRPRSRQPCSIPETEMEDLAYLSGGDLGELMDAEFEATEASLAAAGRPNVRLEIDAVTAHAMGELLYAMEAACILAGELMGINPFDQPAVEWGKRATRQLLSERSGPAAETVGEKTTLSID